MLNILSRTGALSDLNRIRNDVSKILSGLRNGDLALGIPSAETASAGIRSIDAVNEIWSTVDTAAADILADQSNTGSLDVITDAYQGLFEQTSILASDISGIHSDPLELLQSDAITLGFVGRQTTLLYRMERIVCGMVTGNAELGTVDELAETIDLFEISLNALQNGLSDAGISPPPNDAVLERLNAIAEHWAEEKAVFDAIIANGGTEESIADVHAHTSVLLKDVNNAITLYLIATPGQEGVYRLPVNTYATDELSQWLNDPEMIEALNAQNDAHQNLSEEEIVALDQDWRAQAGEGGGALISQLLEHEVSDWLRDQQAGTAGLVTEVFIMDNRGLNVAQSVETSDYWQGDEAKWQETYGAEGAETHISEIEFDDSTGLYQTQASMPIFDPQTNEKIGAITFGINVQSLM